MGSITFFSTIEECDKEFGEPTKKTESERRYLYNREYEVVISFDGDCIGSMGIYRKKVRRVHCKNTRLGNLLCKDAVS